MSYPSIDAIDSALIAVVDKLINNQKIVKLVAYNTDAPLDDPDISLPAWDLLGENVFITPVNPNINNEAHIELRVFAPNFALINGEVLLDCKVFFEIVVHKDLQTIKVNNEIKTRAYQIIDEIVKIFWRKSYPKIGTLEFKNCYQRTINEFYDIWILEAVFGSAKQGVD